jgi:hypothetical protein
MMLPAAAALPQTPVTPRDLPEGVRPVDPPITEPTLTSKSGATLRLFPGGDVYEPYVADPHRPGNTIQLQFFTRKGVVDSSGYRVGLCAGGRFGLLKYSPANPTGRSWQLSSDAALRAVFDAWHKLDNLGWDGNYGLTLTSASSGPLAFKLAWLHTSAHVGDEYTDRTGRARTNYTREEAALGLAWKRGLVRVYAESGYGFYLLNEEVQQPWRAQGGVEVQSRQTRWKGRLGLYLAADFQALQERDWRLDTCVQAGVYTRSGGKVWRVGVQYSDGRVPLGEFYQNTEAWFTVGAWIDF